MISIVLPVQDQAGHIGRILESYLSALEEVGEFELIPVLNASTDASEAIIRALAERDPRVRPQATPERGWGRAVRLGLAAARGEVLCYTNSARTHADDLALMIRRHCDEPSAVVKATRVVRENLPRRLGSASYNLECRLLFGLTVCDVNGTPKVFRRELLDRFGLADNGDCLDLELLAKCRRHGVPVVEVPITATQRHGGVSSTKIRTALGLWTGALKLRLRRDP